MYTRTSEFAWNISLAGNHYLRPLYRIIDVNLDPEDKRSDYQEVLPVDDRLTVKRDRRCRIENFFSENLEFVKSEP